MGGFYGEIYPQSFQTNEKATSVATATSVARCAGIARGRMLLRRPCGRHGRGRGGGVLAVDGNGGIEHFEQPAQHDDQAEEKYPGTPHPRRPGPADDGPKHHGQTGHCDGDPKTNVKHGSSSFLPCFFLFRLSYRPTMFSIAPISYLVKYLEITWFSSLDFMRKYKG